jgi:hypothetical protein
LLTLCLVVGGLLIRAALNTSLWNNAWSQHMVRKERKKEAEGGWGERQRERGGRIFTREHGTERERQKKKYRGRVFSIQ